MQHRILFLIIFIVAAFIICGSGIVTAAEMNKESVSFKTDDGVIIKGYYIPPQKSDGKVFILLPMLARTKETYNDFAQGLTKLGYGVLAYDQRGHGESTSTTSAKKVSYELFNSNGKDNDWNKMIGDVGTAVNFLTSKKKIKESRIGIVGASIGANIALNYAAKNSAISPVVLLSPGESYHNVATADVVYRLKDTQKLFIAASQNDLYSYSTSEKLKKIVISKNASSKNNLIKNVDLLLKETSGHGTDMLRSDGTMNKIFVWIMKNS